MAKYTSSTTKTSLSDAFDHTLKTHRISGRALSQAAGVSEAHISQIRNGRGGDVAHTTLERILDAMEQISPGARADFGQSWLGGERETSIAAAIATLEAADLSASDVSRVLMCMALKLRETAQAEA